MLNCWDENSTNRASFTQLRKRFDAMLSSLASKVSVSFIIGKVIQPLVDLKLHVFFLPVTHNVRRLHLSFSVLACYINVPVIMILLKL